MIEPDSKLHNRKSASTTAKIIILLLAIPCFLFLSELVLTIIPVNTFFENRFFLVNRALDYPDAFQMDRRLLWRLRPSHEISSRFFENKSYKINSDGLRGKEINDPKEKFRILALGNSCTFGWGISTENTYARILERLTNTDDALPEVEVINAGIPGYSSFQGRRFYTEDLHRLKPDIILLMFGWNDQWAAADNIMDKNREFPSDWIINLQNTFARLKTYALLRKIILQSTEESLEDKLSLNDGPRYRVSFEDFKTNLKTMVRFAYRQKTHTIILTSPMPSPEKYYPPGSKSSMHQYHEAYNMMARQAANTTVAESIDLAAIFNNYDNLFDDATNDPIHFNTRGHEIAAEAIYEYLKNNSEVFTPPELPPPLHVPWKLR